jgi:hypothetical protein
MRRSLSNLTIREGDHVGDFDHNMAQLITHERTHCSLSTEDFEYGWDKCAILAAHPRPRVDPLENADSISAIVFYLCLLVCRPGWDFSEGIAQQRTPVPGWLFQYSKGIISADAVLMEPKRIEPRIVHLRDRDVF